MKESVEMLARLVFLNDLEQIIRKFVLTDPILTSN